MDDDQEKELARMDYWMGRWAESLSRDRAEIAADLSYPPTCTIGAMAATNFAVADDDGAAYYDRHEGRQVVVIDTMMSDLRGTVPWAYWAICRKHRLGSMGLDRYDRLAKGGMIPPGMYLSALEELIPAFRARGLL